MTGIWSRSSHEQIVILGSSLLKTAHLLTQRIIETRACCIRAAALRRSTAMFTVRSILMGNERPTEAAEATVVAGKPSSVLSLDSMNSMQNFGSIKDQMTGKDTSNLHSLEIEGLNSPSVDTPQQKQVNDKPTGSSTTDSPKQQAPNDKSTGSSPGADAPTQQGPNDKPTASSTTDSPKQQAPNDRPSTSPSSDAPKQQAPFV